MTQFPRRGEVWTVRLDPAVGSELQKTRLALILQNDLGNEFSPTTIVAPLTRAGERLYPFLVLVKPPEGGVIKPSVANLAQIRVVDKQRLTQCLGELTEDTMREVDRAICTSLRIAQSPPKD